MQERGSRLGPCWMKKASPLHWPDWGQVFSQGQLWYGEDNVKACRLLPQESLSIWSLEITRNLSLKLCLGLVSAVQTCVWFSQKPSLIRENTYKNSRWDFCRLYSVNPASAAKWSTVPGATSVSTLWVVFFAHYFLANDTSLNFHLMTQLRVLTVDSSCFFCTGGDPMLGGRGLAWGRRGGI